MILTPNSDIGEDDAVRRICRKMATHMLAKVFVIGAPEHTRLATTMSLMPWRAAQVLFVGTWEAFEGDRLIFYESAAYGFEGADEAPFLVLKSEEEREHHRLVRRISAYLVPDLDRVELRSLMDAERTLSWWAEDLRGEEAVLVH